MAKSVTRLRSEVESPFFKNTTEIFSALVSQSEGLMKLQEYFDTAENKGLARTQTFELAETFLSLEQRLSKQERLKKEDYIEVVDNLIDIILRSYIEEGTKLENVRKNILLKILKDQDLHHKIITAGSAIEVTLILASTIIYSLYCNPIAPILSSLLLSGPYLQYSASKPIHNYREGIPKSYKLEINRRIAVENGKIKNAILSTIFIAGFNLSIIMTPYAYKNEPIEVEIIKNDTSLDVSKTVGENNSIKNNIGAAYVGIGLILEIIVAYMFIGFSKKVQKKMNKRDEVLMTYLNTDYGKNQDFFLSVLETLETFKGSLDGSTDEKELFRLLDTLNKSLSILENNADTDIKELFKRTTVLINEIRNKNKIQNISDFDPYPLLKRLKKSEEIIPSKKRRNKNDNNQITNTENPANDQNKEIEELELEKVKRLETIKEIDFPKRMKQIDITRFIEFMGGKRDNSIGTGSHFSYRLYDSISRRECILTLSNREEYFGSVLKNWFFRSGHLSPKFVLGRWKEFKN